jgi:predicted PurR-regulated permease PerM
MKISFRDFLKVGIWIFVLYLCINYWQNVAHSLSMIFSAAFPLITGGVIAYFVNILMSFYERHYFPKSKKAIVLKTKRGVCMAGAFFTIVALVSLVICIVLPQLILCFQLLFKELPSALSYLITKAGEFNLIPDNIADFLIGIDWQSRIGEIVEMLTSGVGNIMNAAVKAVTKVFSGIITGLLSIIFAVYLLVSKDRLKAQTKRVLRHYLKSSWCEKLFYVIGVLDDCLHRYVVGQCTEAVILGLLCTFGMWLFRLPYAPMIGALIAFTALIPIAGAYIGAGIGAFMLLTVSPIKALGFLVFIVVLQQLEGNLIYPKVVGNSIGLPGIWVLAAVTIGGGILGITGMLLGVPVAAAVYRIVKDDLNGRSLLKLTPKI